MLVISRKPHEKIVIPAIQASIRVAAVQPGVVRVAINAPHEVVILRGEVADRMKEWETPAPAAVPARSVKARRSGRRLRERLRLASMSVGLARLQMHTSMNPRAAAILHQAHRHIEALCRHLDRKKARTRGKSASKPSPQRSADQPSLTRDYSPALLQAIDA